MAALAAAILILVTQREPEIRRDPIAQGPAAPKYAEDRRDPAPTESSTESTRDDGGQLSAGGEPRKMKEGRGEQVDGLAGEKKDSFEEAGPDVANTVKSLDERLALPEATAPRVVADQVDEQDRVDRSVENVGRALRDQVRTESAIDSEPR